MKEQPAGMTITFQQQQQKCFRKLWQTMEILFLTRVFQTEKLEQKHADTILRKFIL